MKNIILLVLFVNVLFGISIKEAVEVYPRGELIYKKFSSLPFTGVGKFANENNIHLFVVKNGKFNGLYELWTHKGQLILRAFKKNKIYTGRLKSWDTDGTVSSDLIYSKDGKIISGFKKYTYNGVTLVDLVYKNGKKSGFERIFREDYKKSYDVYYEANKEIKRTLIH